MIRRSATKSATDAAPKDDPPAMPAMIRFRRALDARALAAGAVVGLAALAVVALVSAQTGTSDGGGNGTSPQAEVLLSLAAVGLVAAGAVAARRCRRAPLAHGGGAAVAAVLVAETVVVARQVLGDDPVRWWAAVAWLLLALACGMVGGLATLRAPRLRRRADSPT